MANTQAVPALRLHVATDSLRRSYSRTYGSLPATAMRCGCTLLMARDLT